MLATTNWDHPHDLKHRDWKSHCCLWRFHRCHGHCHQWGYPRSPLWFQTWLAGQNPRTEWRFLARKITELSMVHGFQHTMLPKKYSPTNDWALCTGHPRPFGKHTSESTTALCPSKEAMGSDRRRFQILGNHDGKQGAIPTPLNNMSSSIGKIIPNNSWRKKNMFQTTNQSHI